MSNNSIGYKAQCNGNDFIIIIKDKLLNPLSKKFIQAQCNRKNGVGADGLIVVDLSIDGYDFKMDYYNNDGSWETMCANGALCVINILISNNHNFIYNKFVAGDGEHKLDIKNEIISIKMKSPCFKTDIIKISDYLGAHIDSGAKHFVMLSNIDNIDELYSIGQSIRYDKHFAPSGLNVNFLKIINSQQIHVITYEKGIEEIMRSCGSGSVAAAFYGSHHKELKSPLTITNPGGKMKLIFNDNWHDVWLSSNPTIEFEVNIN